MVIVSLVISHGPEYLFAAVVLMGLIQLGVGFLKLGKFIRLVPHPVVYGFVNGLAIVIFMSQLNEFKVASGPNAGEWITGPALYLMLGLVLATMAIIYFLPRFTKAIPPSLAAILASAANFQEKFDIEGDPAHIYIDFAESRVADHSAIDALDKITRRYNRVGKRVSIINLDRPCMEMLNRAGNIIAIDYAREEPATEPVKQIA